MSQNQFEKIKTASPLDLPKAIMDTELYDRQSAKDVFDEINANFERDSMESNVIMPVFTTIIDALLELKFFRGITKKLGLTAGRVINECRSFNYDGKISMLIPDSVEAYNQAECQREWAQKNRSEYIRGLYENISSMGKYKKEKKEGNGSKKNMSDEYTNEKNITAKKNNPDYRRNDPQNDYNAETDHIVPLKEIFDRVQTNSGLSDEDIKDIANQEYNYAVTGRRINNAKREMTNSEFISKQDELKKTGKPYIELSPEVRANMIRMEQEAEKQIENNINKTVLNNLIGQGNADRVDRKAAMEQRQQELGRKLTEDERRQVDAELARQKAKDIHIGNAKAAGEQSLRYALGSIVLMVIKPLYYELRDGFANGFKEGVNAKTYKEAFKIRFGRIKKYVISQIFDLKNLLGNVMDIIKTFLSTLIEGLIGMFVGIFKQVFRLIKEGIKVFVKAWPVLFGKESKQMTPAQKGDAIVKILGGCAVSLCGIGINMLLEKCGVPEWLNGPLSVLLSGLASALLFYALDKADLFNVKTEQRHQRIDEIFNERIKDMKENVREFKNVTAEVIQKQTAQFNTLIDNIKNNLATANMSAVNDNLLALAQSLGIEVGHNSREKSVENRRKLDWNL